MLPPADGAICAADLVDCLHLPTFSLSQRQPWCAVQLWHVCSSSHHSLGPDSSPAFSHSSRR